MVVFSPSGEQEASSVRLPAPGDNDSDHEKPSTGDSQQKQFDFKNWYVCPKSLVLRLED
jgi:hypothetical protein